MPQNIIQFYLRSRKIYEQQSIKLIQNRGKETPTRKIDKLVSYQAAKGTDFFPYIDEEFFTIVFEV
jgi:hypothetical protein